MADRDAALERQLKRQALQLAAMLPDDPDAAVQVLGYAFELIEDFVRPTTSTLKPRSATSTGGPLRLVVSGGAVRRTEGDAS